MIEHDFEFNKFIGGWYIPENICDNVIKFYKQNSERQTPGYVGRVGNIDESMKKASEIYVDYDEFDNECLCDYFKNLGEVVDLYLKKYMNANYTENFSITETAKIQYYKPSDGYYTWHMENNGKGSNRNRHLVFMTYLNDVTDGGGTEFEYQEMITPAKKGLTLIWPAGWTHTHRGQVSNTQEKYIVTGWYSFYD